MEDASGPLNKVAAARERQQNGGPGGGGDVGGDVGGDDDFPSPRRMKCASRCISMQYLIYICVCISTY